MIRISSPSDRQKLIQRTTECFHQALKLTEASDEPDPESCSCLMYNLACVNTYKLPFNETLEHVCKTWIHKCLTHDSGLLSDMACDKDLRALAHLKWFKELINEVPSE